MEPDCDRKLEAKTVKTEPDSEEGFPLVDKRVSAVFFIFFIIKMFKIKDVL